MTTQSLLSLQPSQLFVSQARLSGLDVATPWGPFPVRAYLGRLTLTDGHTRALALYLAGIRRVQVEWDRDELSGRAYRTCVRWCLEQRVTSVADLAWRVVPAPDFSCRWIDRCAALHAALATVSPALPS